MCSFWNKVACISLLTDFRPFSSFKSHLQTNFWFPLSVQGDPVHYHHHPPPHHHHQHHHKKYVASPHFVQLMRWKSRPLTSPAACWLMTQGALYVLIINFHLLSSCLIEFSVNCATLMRWKYPGLVSAAGPLIRTGHKLSFLLTFSLSFLWIVN